jgi:hypothetical protein
VPLRLFAVHRAFGDDEVRAAFEHASGNLVPFNFEIQPDATTAASTTTTSSSTAAARRTTSRSGSRRLFPLTGKACLS